MKEFWVEIRPWKKEAALAAIEGGATALLLDTKEDAASLARIPIIAPDGDLLEGRDFRRVEITDKASEEKAAESARLGPVIVSTTDWTVIPLENLVAVSDRIIAGVEDEAEAELALGILEKGVGGLLLTSDDPDIIRRVAALIEGGAGTVPLVPLTITGITPVGVGDRVCIDTCSLFAEGEGMLVGNTSSALLLVAAETLENPYVSPRPFRVNAGAVHMYILAPDGRTRYLSEIGAGDDGTAVAEAGKTRTVAVGRVKIERRPLLLIEAEGEGQTASAIIQNAETVRLVGEDGVARSVVELKPGDRILGHLMKGGRHFGVAIDETILER
ncbi:3-dehydroquinate synthase [Methanocalculus chunghsingensis]|uniref:3-dehydroquinate synthase n=1 Tax=Methanocalculus chunghsingensis TaxID=156457 RepID=A0A8J7W5S0_9EURY|nr:3-dehydroquinate synthase II [Methanocalculus chunghsingensis]MBR1368196.1 3-dehydroquinate synthase [Methanocalculus chunghsingensis]